MAILSRLVAFCESDVFFQAELLLLLVSVFVSFRMNKTKPFFVASGACLFTAIGTTIYELSRGWTANMINAETMATTMLSGMLFSTLSASLASGLRSFLVWIHTTVTFALCICLSIGVCTLWMDLARPVDAEVSCLSFCCSSCANFPKLDQSKLRAATFSAMHLVASILVVAEAFSGNAASVITPPAWNRRTEGRDRKLCAVV